MIKTHELTRHISDKGLYKTANVTSLCAKELLRQLVASCSLMLQKKQ